MKHLMRLMLFLIITNSYAQTAAPVWSTIFQGVGDNSDAYNHIISDGSGNLIAVGYTFRTGNYKDILTVKVNASGDTLWTRTKNGKNSGNDVGVMAGADATGNIYVTGVTDDGTTNDDILLIKYDASGNNLWDTSWNAVASFDDTPVQLVMDPSGNILIGGNTEPDTVTGSSDYITLKFAPDGTLIWQQQFSRSGVAGGKDELTGLAVDVTGDVYVTGRSFNGSNDDYYTIKYSSAGVQQWFQIYNGGGTDRATDIETDNSGNVYVTGRSDNGSNDDFRTIKYNSAGVLQWTRAYNGSVNQNDRATSLTLDASGNVFVAGQSDVNASTVTNYDFALVKYDVNGTIQWARTWGSAANQSDVPSIVLTDASGNAFVAGTSDQDVSNNTSNDIMVVMYNSGGSLQWNKMIAGNRNADDSGAWGVITTSNDLVVSTGLNQNTSQLDAAITRYSSSGVEQWTKTYNGKGDFSESAKKVVVDGSNNSYMAGYTFGENRNADAVIVKLDMSGNRLCQFIYNGIKSDDDEFECMGIDPSGNIIAGGYTKVTGQKSDFLLVKWNSNTCDTAWTRTYDFAKQADRIVDLVIDQSSNIYVTGRSDQNWVDSLDNDDIVIMKYNSSGSLLWTQRFNGSGNLRDEPSRIKLDRAGNVLVCGRAENIHDDDFMVMKYDPSTGAPLWNSPGLYNGPFSNDDRALDMAIDSQNNIYLAGYSQVGSGAATEDAAVVKFTSAGTLDNFFGFDGLGNGNDRAEKIVCDNSDQIYFIINSDADPDPLISNYNILTFKSDNNLNLIWSNPRTYDSPVSKDDLGTDLMVISTGDVIVAGSTESDTLNNRVNRNLLLIRYDSGGTMTLLSDFNGAANGDDEGNSLAVSSSMLWVAGYTNGTDPNGREMLINLYDLTTSISSLDNQEFSTVYPNPCSGLSKIKITDLHSRELTIRFTDLTGKVIAEENMQNGELLIDRTNFHSGIVFYSIMEKQIPISNGKIIFN